MILNMAPLQIMHFMMVLIIFLTLLEGRIILDREGATQTNKYYGDENFALLNSEKPDQIRGLDTIYSFKGSGDVSYRISFKTQGAPTARLYYAAGAFCI